MHRILGFVAILWGALRLRLGIPRPAVDSVGFYDYRQKWAQQVARSFHLDCVAHGPLPGPGTLVVCTHSGFADAEALCALLPPAARANYISKKEIGDIPLVGWHMGHYGDVLFDRSSAMARKRVLDEAMARLRAGFSIVLFPEGTRSKTGVPSAAIRPALIEAALGEGVPIQPVGIYGTYGLFERPFQMMKERNVVHAWFGEVRRDYASPDAVWRDVLELWRHAVDAAKSPARTEPAQPSASG